MAEIISTSDGKISFVKSLYKRHTLSGRDGGTNSGIYGGDARPAILLYLDGGETRYILDESYHCEYSTFFYPTMQEAQRYSLEISEKLAGSYKGCSESANGKSCSEVTSPDTPKLSEDNLQLTPIKKFAVVKKSYLASSVSVNDLGVIMKICDTEKEGEDYIDSLKYSVSVPNPNTGSGVYGAFTPCKGMCFSIEKIYVI